MYNITSWHLCQSSENTFKYKFPLIDCIFWQVVEPTAYGVTLYVFESQVNGIIWFIDSLKFHEIGMIEHFGDFDFVD